MLQARLVAETGARVNGGNAPRLPNTLNVTFPGVDATRLLAALGGRLALATGSACASAKAAPSHVLRAMGLSDAEARASVRISLGRPTTVDEAQQAGDWLVAAVAAERARGVAQAATPR